MKINHDHMIVICPHVESGQREPDVLLIESGSVTTATCFPCARDLDKDIDPGLIPMCADDAAAMGVPPTFATPFGADGFQQFDRSCGQWRYQPLAGAGELTM